MSPTPEPTRGELQSKHGRPRTQPRHTTPRSRTPDQNRPDLLQPIDNHAGTSKHPSGNIRQLPASAFGRPRGTRHDQHSRDIGGWLDRGVAAALVSSATTRTMTVTVVRDGAGGRLLLSELASEDRRAGVRSVSGFWQSARAPRHAASPKRVPCVDASSPLQGSMQAEAGVNRQSERQRRPSRSDVAKRRSRTRDKAPLRVSHTP